MNKIKNLQEIRGSRGRSHKIKTATARDETSKAANQELKYTKEGKRRTGAKRSANQSRCAQRTTAGVEKTPTKQKCKQIWGTNDYNTEQKI